MNATLLRGVGQVTVRLAAILFFILGLEGAESGVAQGLGQNRSNMEFEHAATGFSLSGGHAQVKCERCHVQSIFRGTPTQCNQCHSPGGRVVSSYKSANHIPTTANCNSCHRTTSWSPARFTHAGIAPATCAKCHNNTVATGKPSSHLPTTLACDACHRTVAWAGASFRHIGVAPGTCATCHNGVQARGKPAAHISTTASCDSCHRMGVPNWVLVSGGYTHAGIAPGTCITCHNGNKATGKAASHVPTTASCDTCHRTTGWIPATFSHTGVTAGTCATCHNGNTARGKSSTHVPTTASCDTCHRTAAWIPATFSHASVAPGSCATCHNGSQARGKSATHLPTTASCDVCHRTSAWVPATFSHTGVAPGSCATCHNGTTATGKSASHFVTTQPCDVCHRAGSGWMTISAYAHKTAFYKAHRASVTCTACHTNNNEVIAWRFAGYKPDCAGCHAGEFKQGAHKKVDTPTVYYNVAELKDCSGSCHIYTNTTFTTIKTNRSGQHRPTGSF